MKDDELFKTLSSAHDHLNAVKNNKHPLVIKEVDTVEARTYKQFIKNNPIPEEFKQKFYCVEAVRSEPLNNFEPIEVVLPEQKDVDPDFYICSRMRGLK